MQDIAFQFLVKDNRREKEMYEEMQAGDEWKDIFGNIFNIKQKVLTHFMSPSPLRHKSIHR